MSGSRIALDVKGLRTTLFLREGSVDVVRGVSFQINEGETLALVGESGCGKTMAALSVMRLLPDPPARVTGFDTPFPYALEMEYLPLAHRIVPAILETARF